MSKLSVIFFPLAFFLTTLAPIIHSSIVLATPTNVELSKPSVANIIAFSDIQGVRGESEILQLSQLGVLEADSNKFYPLAPITRSQFVTWLVKTYNLLQTHNNRVPALIRLPDTRTSSFTDVPSSHPAFSYIQAAYNAGFLVGYEDGTFKPNNNLTREEMIVMKSSLDSGASGKSNRSVKSFRNYLAKTRGFTDANEIGDLYLNHISFDLGNAAGGKNFQRVYGSTRLYEPKKVVNKAEAAILISKFRKAGTVSNALKKIKP